MIRRSFRTSGELGESSACLVLSDKPVLALALSFSCVPPRSRLRNSTRPPEICQPPALVLFLMVWVAPEKAVQDSLCVKPDLEGRHVRRCPAAPNFPARVQFRLTCPEVRPFVLLCFPALPVPLGKSCQSDSIVFPIRFNRNPCQPFTTEGRRGATRAVGTAGGLQSGSYGGH